MTYVASCPYHAVMHSVPPILANQLQTAHNLLSLPLLLSARPLAQPLTTSSSQSQQQEQRALHGRGREVTRIDKRQNTEKKTCVEGGRWRKEGGGGRREGNRKHVIGSFRNRDITGVAYSCIHIICISASMHVAIFYIMWLLFTVSTN